MAIKQGDFVRVNVTGKTKGTEEIFETSYEEIAKEAGIFDENHPYKPIPIVVGANHLLPAIEEAIIGLEAGDRKTVDIPAKDAYGFRDSKNIRLIPMKEFKNQGMTPFPGMKIQAEGNEGRILTVNGGRVKVDFNHPLAGKDVIFDVEVCEIIESNEEKIKSMIELHYNNPNVDINDTKIEIEDGVANIQLSELSKFDQQTYMEITFIRFRIAKDIWENIEEVSRVNFIDAFEKKEENNDEEENEEANSSSEETESSTE